MNSTTYKKAAIALLVIVVLLGILSSVLTFKLNSLKLDLSKLQGEKEVLEKNIKAESATREPLKEANREDEKKVEKIKEAREEFRKKFPTLSDQEKDAKFIELIND